MTLFAFMDEAGEFVFNRSSCKFLVFASIVTSDPMIFTQEFATEKYNLLKQGCPVERFHACEDKQTTRNRIFEILAATRRYSVHAVVVRKSRINPVLHRYGVYSIAYRTMLRYLVGGGPVNKLHMIVDTVPDKTHQTALVNTLQKRAEEALAPQGVSYTISHHNSAAHAALQAADYCAWAIYKKWNAKDTRSHDLIRGRVVNEFDLFRNGNRDYY